MSTQAILSQFNRKTKTRANPGEAAKDSAVFDDLEHVDADEEADWVNGEESDEDDTLDPAVERSDTFMIEEVALQLDQEDADGEDSVGQRLRPLTREEITLGQFSIAKVS